MKTAALTSVLAVGLAAAALAALPDGPSAPDAVGMSEAVPVSLGEISVVPDGRQEAGTIVDVAVESGSFETLVEALKAAGLVETLSGEGPFTVFAPTDEAFSKLPEGTLEELLADRERLTQILTHHVVSGRVTAEQVMGMESAETLAGESVSIRVEGESVRVGGATVVQADVMASNGVIHVIDTVLMPGEGG